MSYCSKYPPPISSDSHLNWSVNVFGQMTYYGTTPREELKPRTFESYKTPGYRLISRNDLPTQQFRVVTKVITDSGGVVSKLSSYYQNGITHWRTVRKGGASQYLCGAARMAVDINPTLSGQNQTAAIAMATSRALSKCSNMKMNLAQSFAERKQTANLLVNCVNRFVTFAVLVRKGKFSKANEVLRGRPKFQGNLGDARTYRFRKDTLRRPTQDDFASLWLEYSYGWRPLLSDIYGAAELLAQSVLENRPMSAKGYGVARDRELRSYNGTASQGRANVVISSEYSAYVEFFFDLEDRAIDVLKSTGITNPALLAWELLPYSFVVDWFIPVGNYLENVNATHGLKFVKGYRSVKHVIDWSASPTLIYDNYSVESGCTVSAHQVGLQRVALTSFPAPSLPSFDFKLNLNQITSASALLHQLFRR